MPGIKNFRIQGLAELRSANSGTQKASLDTLGDQFTDPSTGKRYVYCQLKASPTDDAVDAVAGDALAYTDKSAWEVGVDLTDMEAKLPAGISTVTIDSSADGGKYLWVQCGGPATLSTTVGNSAAAGDQFALTGTGSADKTFTLQADTTDPPAGVLINASTKEAVLFCDRYA